MEAAELRMLANVLGVPDRSALGVLQDAATYWRWLEEPVQELTRLPLDQWQGEHTRLFIAGYPHTPCPPFASAWAEKRMHGGPMEALLSFYGSIGLASTGMPADFLGTVLECAALLADGPDRSVEDKLWQQHLLPWLPEFTAALARESTLAIYRALARRLDEVSHEYRMATASVGAA